MRLESIEAGKTYNTVKRQKMGTTTMSTVMVHAVKVISVDAERRIVRASWNDNPERTSFEGDYKSWRATRPRPRRDATSRRHHSSVRGKP